MSGNETEDELQMRLTEDLEEAKVYDDIRMIFDEIETFDLHSLLPTQNHSKIIKLVITQQKTSKYFIIGDDKGYISVIGKGQ